MIVKKMQTPEVVARSQLNSLSPPYCCLYSKVYLLVLNMLLNFPMIHDLQSHDCFVVKFQVYEYGADLKAITKLCIKAQERPVLYRLGASWTQLLYPLLVRLFTIGLLLMLVVVGQLTFESH